MDYQIKKAELKDKAAILGFLKETFSGYWSSDQPIYIPEFWDWLYCNNPAGGAITFVAEKDGRIIGHYPNVLQYLKIDNRIFQTGLVLHLATHADYRRLGVFKSLGQASMQELVRSRIPFSIAFPNQKSLPGFVNRLGFFDIATLPLLVKPLKIRNILAKVTKKPGLASFLSFLLEPLYHMSFSHFKFTKKRRNIKIEMRESFDHQFDIFWNRSMAQAKIMAPRDSRYLNWRFKSRPLQDYQILAALEGEEIAGYIIIRNAEVFSLKTGIIMDFFVLPGRQEIFDALLDAALSNLRSQDMDLCISTCFKSNIYYKALKNAGFIAVPAGFNPRKLVLVGRINSSAVDRDLFLNKKNWFITFADWDVF